jgi:hypothetical protein
MMRLRNTEIPTRSCSVFFVYFLIGKTFRRFSSKMIVFSFPFETTLLRHWIVYYWKCVTPRFIAPSVSIENSSQITFIMSSFSYNIYF